LAAATAKVAAATSAPRRTVTTASRTTSPPCAPASKPSKGACRRD